MIFWIALALVAIAIIFVFVMSLIDGEGIPTSIGITLITAFFGAIALGAVIGLTFLAMAIFGAQSTGSESRSSTYELRAVASGSKTSGSFFLGAGSIDGKRTISYIYEKDGWSQLAQVEADNSRIAEDATPSTSTLTSTTVDYYVWWALPWNAWHKTTHDFHVPADSVVDNFEVSAN